MRIRTTLLAASLLVSPVARADNAVGSLDAAPTAAELKLEAARLRRTAAEARPSAGTGVFFPYDAVKLGLTSLDAAKAVVYGLGRCAQVQAVSLRGAYHLERFQTDYALRGVREQLRRDVDDDTDGGRAYLALGRATERRLVARRAALDRGSVEDGLGALAALAPVSGVDYHILPATCPPSR